MNHPINQSMNQPIKKSNLSLANSEFTCTSVSPVENLPNLMRNYYQFLHSKPKLYQLQKCVLQWDTRLCLRVNLLSQLKFFAQFFKTISRLGDGWFWAVSTVVMLVALLSQGLVASIVAIKVCAVLLSSFCGYLLYKYLKVHTVRPRPYQVHQTITLGERPLDVFSFPSGHTLQAVLFTTMIGHQVPMMLWVLLPFTMLVALSRLVLGLHYPTDVLVGAGIGATFATLGSKVSDYLVA